MGAGSAKGLQHEDDDDADRFSNASDKWANDDTSDDDSRKDTRNNNKNFKKTVAEVSPNFEPGPSSEPQPSGERNGMLENKKNPGNEGSETKKKFGFKFGKKDDTDKVDDSADDQDDDKKKKKDAKKDGDKKGGFKLFGWRNKKIEENDGELDKDIDDLEKTFDSLGIVGKNMWDEGGPQPGKPRKETADDLELLEPMRKRKNVRVRGTRGMNGTVAGGHDGTGSMVGGSLGTGGGSSGSRRTFKYSWETENENHRSARDEDDEWEYKAVVIEGFDIDKFRKANNRESMFDSTSLPNAVSGDDFDGLGAKSPLRYDHNEQQILASIERDYTYN